MEIELRTVFSFSLLPFCLAGIFHCHTTSFMIPDALLLFLSQNIVSPLLPNCSHSCSQVKNASNMPSSLVFMYSNSSQYSLSSHWIILLVIILSIWFSLCILFHHSIDIIAFFSRFSLAIKNFTSSYIFCFWSLVFPGFMFKYVLYKIYKSSLFCFLFLTFKIFNICLILPSIILVLDR
jgi:hypothetical protein